MRKDLQRIKRVRTDISEFVLHCTKDKSLSPFDALKLILEDGFLQATYAPVQVSGSGTKPMIRGPHPAVCFTDQPVRFFLQSIKASEEMTRDRYTKFGVAVRKLDLYGYGGRPVIYGNTQILGVKLAKQQLEERNLHSELLVHKGGLPEEYQYLWAHYNPLRREEGRLRPVDFTHEREWRARPNAKINQDIGLTGRPDEVIPLQLRVRVTAQVSVVPTEPRFVILVDTEERKEELAGWIKATSGRIGDRSGYWWRYGLALASAAKSGHILSFERVQSESREPSMCRIEDFVAFRHESTDNG
jgi:hypothetical protein